MDELSKTALVTIFIPCYEQPDYLRECLNSIAKQTFKDFEVVLLDDQSEADYSSVIDSFPELKIKYLRNEKNLGALPNMMQAMKMKCDSKYIVVFHEDDLMHPRMLEMEVGLLEQNDNLVFASTDMLMFSTDQKNPLAIAMNVSGKCTHYQSQADFLRGIISGIDLCFDSVMYRKAALKDYVIDLKRFHILGDRPFLVELLGDKEAISLHDQLVFYRIHEHNDLRDHGLNEEHLINFLTYYRSFFPDNMDVIDRKLFYVFSTNNLLASYVGMSKRKGIGLIKFISKCKKNNIFSFYYLRILGIKSLIKIILPRVIINVLKK